jgi:hypothetical protein
MKAPRESLPNRRSSVTFNFELDGLRYSATVSRFQDGRLRALGPVGKALDLLAVDDGAAI